MEPHVLAFAGMGEEYQSLVSSVISAVSQTAPI